MLQPHKLRVAFNRAATIWGTQNNQPKQLTRIQNNQQEPRKTSTRTYRTTNQNQEQPTKTNQLEPRTANQNLEQPTRTQKLHK